MAKWRQKGWDILVPYVQNINGSRFCCCSLRFNCKMNSTYTFTVTHPVASVVADIYRDRQLRALCHWPVIPEQRELLSLETLRPRLPGCHVTTWRPVIGQLSGHVTRIWALIGRDWVQSARAPCLLLHPNIRTAEILQLGEFTTSCLCSL